MTATHDVARMFESALGEIYAGVFFIDPEWRLLFINDQGRQLFPSDSPILVGQSIWEIDPTIRDDEFGMTLERVLKTGHPEWLRGLSPELGGWFETAIYPTDFGLAVYLQDVTADQKTREQLAESTRRTNHEAALLNVARDAIYVREFDHTISYWNKGAERLYGWTAEEMVGKSTREVLYDGTDEFDRSHAQLLRDGAWQGELTQVARDGRRIVADARWQVASNDDGDGPFILCVVTDVTELRREQEKYYRTQRMESLGTLAGGMAHDLNNVLSPILISAQFLADDEVDPERRQVLANIETSARRGADMIRHVLAFARGEDGRRQPLDIAEIVRGVVLFCQDTLPKNIEIRSSVPDDAFTPSGDQTQIMQVMLNLATNARDAMPDGGVLTVSARNRASDVELGTEAAVLLSIEDTGMGMSAETKAKVFEPFFSSKEIGTGTGLGLSTSLAIARGHGGELEVYSELGRGSRFELRLPVQPGMPEPALLQEPAVPAELRGDGQRVLIVDDESTIRNIVQRILETNGYRTALAGNGAEAIELLDAPDSDIQIVFTDMMMPVAGGAVVAAHLLAKHPNIPVIAASGLGANSDAAEAAHFGARHFLPKPFNSHELLVAIRSVAVAG